MDLPNIIRVFMAGDLILGRGIDQLLPYPSHPKIYESHIKVTDARVYVKNVISNKGPFPENSTFEYIWGDALDILEDKDPDFRLINLENAITVSDTPWPKKDLLFRMHPKNIKTLKVLKTDCCVLCNNHVLDWGYEGLAETISTLKQCNLGYVGAGDNISEAQKPAIFELPNDKGRIVVFARCHGSAHIPGMWAANPNKPGICLLPYYEMSKHIQQLSDQVKTVKKAGDLVILSLHWGSNWDWTVPEYQQKFARAAIDEAGFDAIHGHSSHHVKGVEVYHGKLITYGLGDLINDFEGSINQHLLRISHEYHYDWNLMYFADFNKTSGDIVKLRMVPTMISKFQVQRADDKATKWLHDKMDALCQELGSGVERVGDELELVIPISAPKDEL